MSLVIVPALAGSAFAAAHALTAYLTKPLHALGFIHLRFDGWAHRNETVQFLWDLLFYEPYSSGSVSWSPSARSTTIAAPEAPPARDGG